MFTSVLAYFARPLIVAVSRATFVRFACLGMVRLLAGEDTEILLRGNGVPRRRIAIAKAVTSTTRPAKTTGELVLETLLRGSRLPPRKIVRTTRPIGSSCGEVSTLLGGSPFPPRRMVTSSRPIVLTSAWSAIAGAEEPLFRGGSRLPRCDGTAPATREKAGRDGCSALRAGSPLPGTGHAITSGSIVVTSEAIFRADVDVGRTGVH